MTNRQEVARIAMQDADNPVIQGQWSLLLKYGRHLETCWSRVSNQPCDCGWDEMKRDLEVIVK